MYQPQRLFRIAHSRTKAFTLIELLVCMFLLSLISTILIAILSQSSALISQGTTKIQLNQKSRHALERIVPYVATAVPGNAPSEAITFPLKLKESLDATEVKSYKTLRFTTTEDFLHPGYDAKKVAKDNPATPSAAVYSAWVPGDPQFEYEFVFDTTGGKTYTTTTVPPETYPLGQIVLQKLVAGVPATDPAPRVVAHQVLDFFCYRLTSNAVEVRILSAATRKGPAGNLIDVYETESAIIPVPSANYL